MDVEQLLKEEELQKFPQVEVSPDYSATIIADNLPVIPREKEARLVGIVKKIFEHYGKIVDFHMPFITETQSAGFAFIQYEKAMDAAAAVKNLDNHALDKAHVFRVNHFDDFLVADKAATEYKAPEETPFDENVEDLFQWLLDPNGSDQFVVRYGEFTEVLWNGVGQSAPHFEEKRAKWTDSFVQWSPNGSYLVSLHPPGAVLWGGKAWKKLKRFRHPNIDMVAFSPNEKYMITYSQIPAEKDNADDPQAIVIWDVITGQKLRGFVALDQSWPAFQWSPDDKYFSRVKDGLLYLYEAPSMNLVDKKPMRLSGPVKEHQWSPADNFVAAYIPESGNVPAKIVVVEIPSQKVVAQTTLFNVTGASMRWQDKGDFLAVKADRHRKSKKQTYVSFEFFRIRDKGVPVETAEIEDAIVDYKWELKGGKKFGVIHGTTETATRTTIDFFSLEGKALKKIVTLEKRPANVLFWSPGGRYCLLAGLENLNGVFEFYDVQGAVTLADDRKHFMCTNVEWDPTGRYVATLVSAYKTKNENGYKLWTWAGKEIFNQMKSPFYQFNWRPRPPSLLSKDQQKWIQNPENFKTFQDKYRQQDRQSTIKRFEETRRKRDQVRQDYRLHIARMRADLAADSEWRKKHHILEDREEDFVTVEDTVQEVIEETEEVIA